MRTPNLNYIENLAAGDKSVILKTTTLLKKEFLKEMKLFYKKNGANDFEGLASIVHKVKYKFGLLGLNEELKLATRFEHELKKGNKELYSEFEEILLVVERYLKTI